MGRRPQAFTAPHMRDVDDRANVTVADHGSRFILQGHALDVARVTNAPDSRKTIIWNRTPSEDDRAFAEQLLDCVCLHAV